MNARGSLLFGLLLLQFAAACGDDRRMGAVVRRDFGEDTDPDGGIVTPADNGVAPVADTGVAPNRDAEVAPDRPIADGGGGFADATIADGGMSAALVTVRTLQDQSASGRPPVDTLVRVENVVVSAVQTTGDSAGSFWVQEAGGGPFSGILIFVPLERVGTFSVLEGDVLNITGMYAEYFDVTEIEYQEHEFVRSGSAPLPQEVDPTDIANGGSLGEAFEGVLVRVSSVTVLSDNPDAPMDFGEFQLTSNLRIDDQIYRLSPRPLPGTFLTSITGVHHHSFANYKLLPRSAADYVY